MKRNWLISFPCSAAGWRGERPCLACTPLCVTIPPEEIAFAAIRVAVELLQKKDPPPALRRAGFDVNHDDVVLACREMLDFYKFPSAVFEEDGGAAAKSASGRQGVEGSGGGRQQFLRQHRHEVAAFLLACKERGAARNA